MAQLDDYKQQGHELVTRICKPGGCIYARWDCKAKYAEEVVNDFAGDGCFSAARQSETDDQKVKPGQMTSEGKFIAFTDMQETPSREHGMYHMSIASRHRQTPEQG